MACEANSTNSEKLNLSPICKNGDSKSRYGMLERKAIKADFAFCVFIFQLVLYFEQSFVVFFLQIEHCFYVIRLKKVHQQRIVSTKKVLLLINSQLFSCEPLWMVLLAFISPFLFPFFSHAIEYSEIPEEGMCHNRDKLLS